MSKKKFDTSELIDGLTGGMSSAAGKSVATTEKPRRGRPPMSDDEKRFCSSSKREFLDKLKYIATYHNVHTKDILTKAIENYIEGYEQKYGPIKLKRPRKPGDINDIL